MTQKGDVHLDWWKEGLLLKLRIRPAGVALAVLYALACWATRQLSLDQFYLPAGIRVAAVLLCPPRFWPYLLLGEYAYFAQMRLPMIDRHGLAWVVLASAFLMPAVMLIVTLHRRMLEQAANAGLLSVALLSAIAVTLINVTGSQLLWVTPPTDNILDFSSRAIRFIVGDFIGILTVAPLAIMLRRWYPDRVWRPRIALLSIVAGAAMITLGVSAALLVDEPGVTRTSLQLLMGLPAVALTCLIGWKGAAIAVPMLNLIIGLSTHKPYPAAFDSTTFTTQLVMAITGIALLMLGSRISHYHHRYRLRETGERKAIDLAKASQAAGEMALRERALHLRKLGDGLDASLTEVVYWLNQKGYHTIASSLLHTAEVHSRLFREQANMVYPTALEQLGLYVSLQAGGAITAWNRTDRITRPRLSGDPCKLSLPLQLAAYRTLVEAVSLVVNAEPGQLVVRSRCGRIGRQRGIVMIVGLLDRAKPLSAETTLLAGQVLGARTLAFDGIVQCQHNRIRISLTEIAGEVRASDAHDAATPLPLSNAWGSQQAQA